MKVSVLLATLAIFTAIKAESVDPAAEEKAPPLPNPQGNDVADKWPGEWCDKQCTETTLFANACSEKSPDCRCSSHFWSKLSKCKQDGCGQNYKTKNWSEKIDPLLLNCDGGRYYDGYY